jgi:hypothetical protein
MQVGPSLKSMKQLRRKMLGRRDHGCGSKDEARFRANTAALRGEPVPQHPVGTTPRSYLRERSYTKNNNPSWLNFKKARSEG